MKTVKKALIIISFVVGLLLMTCGCDRFKKDTTDSSKPTETTQIVDKGIAFEVFERIPKSDLGEFFREKTYICPNDSRRHFGDSDDNSSNAVHYMEGGSNSFSVDCFPMNNGGWLAMLVNEGCFDGCGQTMKTYLYKDGVLNYAPNMLPRPTMEEMVDFPFLLYGISDDEIDDLKSEWDERLLYYVIGDDTLQVAVETLNYDEQFISALSPKMYVWDGESFVPFFKDEPRAYRLIDFDGLGGLRLNDTMPEELPGLYKCSEVESVAFIRDGELFVRLHPDGEGMIQAIDVYAKELTYYRGKIGDTLNRLLYKGAAENKAYFRNGEFVVNEVANYTENRIDYVGPKDAMNGIFVEGPIEDPKFRPDATVQYIRIYKPNHWENDTCDMRALREALDEALLFDGNPEYEKNDFKYYREMYNEACQGWCDAFYYYLHCYPLKTRGFKVYVTTDWQPGTEGDTLGGFTRISAYLYKDGVLTEVEPEPELNDFPLKEDASHFASVVGVYFYDRTMTVATGYHENGKMQGVEFTWDGTTMKKTYQGTFEN